MKILLLGPNGFVGKALGAKLEVIHELVSVYRETNLVDFFESEQIFDFVINCASSHPMADSRDSNESNFLYPKRFFNNLSFAHWIQIESYFQLQIPFGRIDPYSIEKEKFSRFLDENSHYPESPLVSHLYLPHIFGEGDRPERLISSAIANFNSGHDFHTSSGTQFLPLLYISDAVEGIVRFIERPTEQAACVPFWYGSVRDLLDLMASQFSQSRVIYGSNPDPVDACFPRVEFPQCVDGWKPKMQLAEFLEWVRVRNG
jgi:nucleoside-diphosphate-sugar epimerase